MTNDGKQNNWRWGSLFGIPLYIDSSWLIILVLVTIVDAGEVNAYVLGGENYWLAGIAGLAMALLLFSSVLLHELGHSLVARSQGIAVKSITLFLFGGVAAIEKESKTPAQALQVAVAGPIVSFSLFLLFFLLQAKLPESSLLQFLVLDLARINFVLAMFNLIPGLPLDGGQVLKAMVWKVTGDRFLGMKWAAASGKTIGWLGISFGSFLLIFTGQIGLVWIILIAWFILRNANAYERLVEIQTSLQEIMAAEVMTREFRVVNAKLNLREFAEQYLIANLNKSMPFYAASEGRYRGLIAVEDLHATERSEWEEKTLADLAYPLSEIPSATEKANLLTVINTLETRGDRYLTILSPAGAVAGVIDRGDIVKFVSRKLNLEFPEAEIKRIKAEGTYPPNLPLDAIVKTFKD